MVQGEDVCVRTEAGVVASKEKTKGRAHTSVDTLRSR